MTEQSESERTPPIITTENDIPFCKEKDSNPSEFLDKDKDLSMTAQKFKLGSSTLGWCIFLMSTCVILSLVAPGKGLVEEAFDAFKLIVMTILGYVFGSEKR